MGFDFGSFLGGAGGGLVSNLIPGLKQFSPAISAGIGALANKDNRLGGAMQGFAGGGLGQSLGSGISQGIGGLTKPGGTFGKAMSGFGAGAQAGAKNYMNAIPGMGGTFSGAGVDAGPQGALAKFFGGMGSGKRQPAAPQKVSGGGTNPFSISKEVGTQNLNPYQQASSNMGVAPTPTPGSVPSVQNASAGTGPGVLSKIFGQAGATTPEKQSSMMDQFKKAAIGTGIAGIGDMFAPKVETPNVAGIGQDLQARMQAGELGDPVAKKAGMQELLATLGRPMGEVPMSAFNLGDSKSDEAKIKALQNYTNHWKNIRPGADFSNDAEFQRGYQEIVQEYDNNRIMERDQQQFQYDQQQRQEKYNYMVQALNIDQAQMEQYIALADLEVNQLMMEYGISAQEATEFKSLFADFGQNISEGGQQQGQSPIQINLGQPEEATA